MKTLTAQQRSAFENFLKEFKESTMWIKSEEAIAAFNKIGVALKSYIESTPENLLLLAKNGWFMDFDQDLRVTPRIAKELISGNINKVDDFLMNYYSERFEFIIQKLNSRHERRSKIFDQIFEAHKSELYCASVPLLLTQIDGICLDHTSKQFFMKDSQHNHLPKVSVELESASWDVADYLMSPIKHQIPIYAREVDIKKFPCNLNRHAILHGSDTEFGTVKNSLKCLSLLKYISDILHFAKKSSS